MRRGELVQGHSCISPDRLQYENHTLLATEIGGRLLAGTYTYHDRNTNLPAFLCFCHEPCFGPGIPRLINLEQVPFVLTFWGAARADRIGEKYLNYSKCRWFALVSFGT